MKASIGGLFVPSFAEKVIIQIPHPTNYGRIIEIEITQFDLQGISRGIQVQEILLMHPLYYPKRTHYANVEIEKTLLKM